MEYSRIFGSKFPDALIPVGDKKDVDNTVASLINQYYSYVDSGNISRAKELYEANKSELQKYIIDMEYINRLEEEIFNTGLGALKVTTSVVQDYEPLDQGENAYWFKDY